MEADLGVLLFDRNTRNVVMTSAGEALLPIVERLEAQHDDALAQLESILSGSSGLVTLGVLPSLAAGALPGLLVRFHDEFPEIGVQIKDELAGTLNDLMLDRKVDLSLGTAGPHNPEFLFEPLFEDAFVLVAKRGTTLAGAGPVSWATFCRHPFIALASSSGVRLATDAAFVNARISLRPAFECRQLATVGALVAAGLGLAALPASTLPMLNSYGLLHRPLKQPRIDRVIGLTYLKERTLSPAATQLRSFLLEHRAALAGPKGQ